MNLFDILNDAVLDIFIYVTMGLFLILPPGLLFARNCWKPRIHTAWLFLGFAVLGWLLLNAYLHLSFEYLARQVQATPNPSDELIDSLNSDGAVIVFTFLFGWLYATIYFALWFVPLRIGQWVWERGKVSHRGTTGQESGIPRQN